LSNQNHSHSAEPNIHVFKIAKANALPIGHSFAASNSTIQASIARSALSIFSGVGRPWSRLEIAIPTLARASLRVPPLDRFKIASCFALLSVAKTADFGVAVNSALIAALAAFAAFTSSLMWTTVRHFSTLRAQRGKSHTFGFHNFLALGQLPWQVNFWAWGWARSISERDQTNNKQISTQWCKMF
jgi:hypothetical protein